MHWLDTVILCVLAAGALFGALTGLLWQMFLVIATGAGLYCTITLNDTATNFVERHLMEGAAPGMARGVAYILVFALVFLLLLILTLMLHRVVRQARLQWLNRLLGAGFVGLVVASALGLVFLVLDANPASRAFVEQSKIAPVLITGLKNMVASVPEDSRKLVEDKIGQTLPQHVQPQIVPMPQFAPPPQAPQKKQPALQIPLADRVLEEINGAKN
jgi:uncharacterized membrane protein required for colicin V production